MGDVSRLPSPRRWRRAAIAVLVGLLASASEARADEPALPVAPLTYSPYERATIDAAMQKLAGSVETSPEGMELEDIAVVSLDVFEKRDPLPGFAIPIANFFHATTRSYVIEREVLLARGDRYQQALVDETARNLRGLPQLSLVLCVPLVGSAPGKVRLLVITKDVWSLRLNSNFRFADGRLQYLLLQPAEENLLGTHQQILGNFVLDPATIALGGQYAIPRIAGSRIALSAGASVVLNRGTGQAEGSYGSFTYSQPLYSTRTEWAWSGHIGWDEEIIRRFVGGQFTSFDPSSNLCQPVAAATPESVDPTRCQYRSDVLSGDYSLTRSFGTRFKHNLSLGIGASRKVYRTDTDFNAAQQAQFLQAFVPVSDTKIGPYVYYHDYESRYLDVLDFEILGLQENPHMGHDFSVKLSPVSTAFNSSRNLFEVAASASYALPLGDGLFYFGASTDVEITRSELPDAEVDLHLRVATPRFGIGRLVFDSVLTDRMRNYLNAKSYLGGDTRLRGYPTQQFVGNDLFATNLEYRSRPFELLSVQIGGAAFFDTGDAFDSFDKIVLKHSVGVGLRAGFPQLQRSVLRVDWGFPLTLIKGSEPSKSFPGDVVVTFDQAFPY